eukprot:6472260-Amphidinium_carterae.1
MSSSTIQHSAAPATAPATAPAHPLARAGEPAEHHLAPPASWQASVAQQPPAHSAPRAACMQQLPFAAQLQPAVTQQMCPSAVLQLSDPPAQELLAATNTAATTATRPQQHATPMHQLQPANCQQ